MIKRKRPIQEKIELDEDRCEYSKIKSSIITYTILYLCNLNLYLFLMVKVAWKVYGYSAKMQENG